MLGQQPPNATQLPACLPSPPMRTLMRVTNCTGMGPSLSTTPLAARQNGMPDSMAAGRSTDSSTHAQSSARLREGGKSE